VRTPKHVALMPDNALAASGHATTAPPSAASNSRRPMVTVIRPSRARCVGNDTTPRACSLHVQAGIPRHERAVFTFKQGRMACFVGVMRGEIFPVQGSTVHSSLVLRSLITAVLCGPSVNMNRDAGAAMV
jgi:hypothetical protein